MKGDIGRLMADNSLPDAARVVGCHIAFNDSGEGVELRHTTVAGILHGWPGEDKVRATLRVLVLAGYVKRIPGGRDHGDRFLWLGDRVGLEPHAKDRVGPEPHPKKNLGLGQDPTLNDRVGVEPHPKLRVVVEEEEVEEEVEETRARRYGLDPRVRDLLDSDLDGLNGCRGAITDYLAARVMGPGQLGYVRSIQAWLHGGSGTPRGLLDLQNPAHMIATALNDLLTEDETQYRSGRGQVGVIANLRAKLSVLIAQELAPRRTQSPEPRPKHRTREVYVEH